MFKKNTLAVLIAAALAQGAGAAEINIEAQDLAGAIRKLGAQAGIQVIFTADDLSGMTSAAIHGNIPGEDALRKLLEGCDCELSSTGTNTFVIRREGKGRKKQDVLGEVTVSASRLADAFQGSQLRGEKLAARRSATSDAAHLLDGEPGVNFWTGGGVSALPAMHGLQDDRVRVLVDGTTITSACSNHMNPALSYVSPSQIERISVFAGITPVSMGGDSIGGTISVESAKPRFAEDSDKLLKSGALGMHLHNNRNGKSVFAEATLASTDNSLSYDAALAQTDSYRRGDNGPVVRRTLYKTFNHSLAFAHRMAEGGIWTADVALQHTPYEGFPNQPMDLTGNNGKRFGLGLEDHYAWGNLSAKLYYHHTDHKMDMLPPPENSGTMPMLTTGIDKGYVVKAEIPLADRSTLRVGNEFHQQRLNDWWPLDPQWVGQPFAVGDFIAINNGTRNRLGTYGEVQTQWDPRWSTLLGIRNDNVRMNTGNVHGYFTFQAADANAFNALDHSRSDNNFDLTALARLADSDTSEYEFGIARKTRSPSLYERYMWFMTNMNNLGMGDAANYKGDINLKPEVAYHFGFTADWHDAQKEQWQVKVAPYYTIVKDYIGGQKVGDLLAFGRPYAQLQYANFKRATLYGIDLSGSSALGGGFKLRGQVGYVRGRNDDTGENLYHIMPLNVRTGVDYATGPWSGSFDLIGVKAKTRVSANNFEPKTAAYMIANLHGGYHLTKDTRVELGCDNLFDKLYYHPMGGVNDQETLAAITASPSTPLANQRLVAAAGRTCSAGFMMKF